MFLRFFFISPTDPGLVLVLLFVTPFAQITPDSAFIASCPLPGRHFSPFFLHQPLFPSPSLVTPPTIVVPHVAFFFTLLPHLEIGPRPIALPRLSSRVFEGCPAFPLFLPFPLYPPVQNLHYHGEPLFMGFPGDPSSKYASPLADMKQVPPVPPFWI